MSTISLRQYAIGVAETDVLSDASVDKVELCQLGLLGESGQLISELKKQHREAEAYHWHEGRLLEEFGDYLWYLTRLSSLLDVQLRPVIVAAFGPDLPPGDPVAQPLAAFQSSNRLEPRTPEHPLTQSVLDFLHVTNKLASLRLGPSDVDHDSVDAEQVIGAAFRTLFQLANERGVPIGQAAVKNLSKTHDRWPSTRVPPPLYDHMMPTLERLPRRLDVKIEELNRGERTFVRQTIGDFIIGDELTDNIAEDDDYRFHDVFHWANAAILGWSPVIRRLLKRKRKSDPAIDENEDGARAAIMEEAIALWVFQQAKLREFFQGLNHLDYEILKNVRMLTIGHEVESAPLWLWERTILDGYRAFIFLKKHRRAYLSLDLDSRNLTWRHSANDF